MNATSTASARPAAPGAGIVKMILNEAANGNVTIQPLRGNLSLLVGSGGNIGVFTGPEGTLFVDAGIGVSRGKIEAVLKNIGAGPIRYLLNTHWHFDHTDGNEWLHAAGATIVAHQNTRKHLATDTRVEGWTTTFPAAPESALPAVVFDVEHTLEFNGASLLLKYYGPCHTDCDISVDFTGSDVFFAGDTWWNGVYPFIDFSTGGTIDGTIRACETNLARFTDKTIIVPGHGPVGDKSQLIEFRDMLVANRANVAALKSKGMTLEDVIAAKPTAAYDAKWGSLVPPALFTQVIYASV